MTLTSIADLDDRDAAILLARQQALYDLDPVVPAQGDWVDFADGTVRRVSHVWDTGGLADWWIQTSDGGSFYLGDGYLSFSGGLHRGIKGSHFTDTNTWRRATAWFFHHDHHTAHNGIDVVVEQRVWHCDVPAHVGGV